MNILKAIASLLYSFFAFISGDSHLNPPENIYQPFEYQGHMTLVVNTPNELSVDLSQMYFLQYVEKPIVQVVEAASVIVTPPHEVQTPSIPIPENRFITLEQLDTYGLEAGWGPEIWPMMRNIVTCENPSLDLYAHNPNDPSSGSYGLAQLNGSYHFNNAGEDFALRFDPVVNLRTARWLWQARGQIFGGSGGWYTCALRFGYQ